MQATRGIKNIDGDWAGVQATRGIKNIDGDWAGIQARLGSGMRSYAGYTWHKKYRRRLGRNSGSTGERNTEVLATPRRYSSVANNAISKARLHALNGVAQATRT